ncbi:hypothetical protein ACIPW9_36460 [Streptomyces sp. NPDC090052]|uniref:hypothetical protein n=1 Tax=Streptomyces sp. NPDC090052 TaxID=3365931 RepID=UPI003812DAE6
MLRRHLGTIVYLTLTIAAGAVYGFLLGPFARGLALWAVIAVFCVVGLVISVLADLITGIAARAYDERQTVKEFHRNHKESGR